MRKVKVGIIGCGTIGTALAKTLDKKFQKRVTVQALCDRHTDRVQKLKKSLKANPKQLSVSKLIDACDIVIEAASMDVSASIAKQALKKHKIVLIMSVGGLVRAPRLTQLAKQGKGRLWIPSGAIAGVDGLLSAAEAKIKNVKIVTKKPPYGLQGAPYFDKRKFPVLRGKKEVRVFRGTALQAVKAFPQNINVAAVLSFAGLGPRKTKVEIWTSKSYKTNSHEVEINADSGVIKTMTANRPAPSNPKTSYLAILSAVAAIRQMVSSYYVGT